MTHYAIEVQLIEIVCKCSKHEYGRCTNTASQKRHKLREAYIGSFGHDTRHLSSAIRKWDKRVSEGFERAE